MADLNLTQAGVKITMTETVNRYRLYCLLDGQTKKDIDKTTLRKLNRIKTELKNNNQLTVSYDLAEHSKAHGLGRLGTPFSCGQLSREFRSALLPTHFDIDMINAMPTLLRHICRQYGWPCPNLDRYVDNRDDVLTEIIGALEINRDASKHTVLILMFLGPLPFNADRVPFLSDFLQEMHAIAIKIADANPVAHTVAQLKKEKLDLLKSSKCKVLASCMSIVIGTLERTECFKAQAIVEQSGRKVEVYMQDGFMVAPRHDNDRELPQALIDQLSDNSGIVKFALKPVVQTLDFPEETDKPIDVVPSYSLDDLRTSGIHYTYRVVKTVFERTHFKTMKPIAYVRHEDGETDMTNKERFKDAYNNLYFWHAPKGIVQKTKFIEKWLDDEHMRTYQRCEFLPPPLDCPANVFNTYGGLAIASVDVKSSGNVEPFLHHIKEVVCSGNQAQADFFVKWLAYVVQFPGKPNGLMPGIVGGEGDGKNSVGVIVKLILGARHYNETSDPVCDLFGSFTPMRENSLFIVLDEVKRIDMKSVWNKVKAMVTSSTYQHKRKYIDATTQKNTTHYLILANEDFPVNAGRRIWVVRSSPIYAGDMAYFKKLYAYYDEPANQKAIYEHLCGIDVSNVNWIRDRPHSAAYDAIQSLSIDPIYKYLGHLWAQYAPTRLTLIVKSREELTDEYFKFVTKKLRFKEISLGNKRTLFNTTISNVMVRNGDAMQFVKNYEGGKNRFVFDKDKLRDMLVRMCVFDEEYVQDVSNGYVIADEEEAT